MVGVVEVSCMTDIPPSHRHRHFTPQARYFALQVCNQVTEVVAHTWVAVPGSRLGEINGGLSVVVVEEDVSAKAEQGPHALRGWTFDCFMQSTGPLDLSTWVGPVFEKEANIVVVSLECSFVKRSQSC